MEKLRHALPPLTTLTHFEAAARLQSFTAAAEEMNVTQAAVSRQIKLLEANLGVMLFERRHRSVILTEDGRRYFDQVAAGLKSLALATLGARQRGEERGVTVFCELSLAAYWLVPRLPLFEQRYPDITVRVISSNQTLDRVSEPFDLGLQTSPRTSNVFTPSISVREEVFPICSPNYLERVGGRLDLAKLADSALLSLRDDAYHWIDWHDWLDHFGQELGPAASLRTYNNYAVLLQAAISGQGVALGWRHSIERLLEDGTLIRPLDISFEFEDGIFLYEPRNALPNGQVRTVFAWLEHQLRQSSGNASK